MKLKIFFAIFLSGRAKDLPAPLYFYMRESIPQSAFLSATLMIEEIHGLPSCSYS